MPGAKDHTFDAMYVQQPEHKLLYVGKLFTAGFVVDSLANGAKAQILFNARSLSMTIFPTWEATANARINMFLVSSWTAGSALNPFNNDLKNHGVSSISGLLITQPTSINVQPSSTSFFTGLLPGGEKSSTVGGEGKAMDHMIIGAGQTVLIELTNSSGAAASGGLGIVIHETQVAPLDDPA